MVLQRSDIATKRQLAALGGKDLNSKMEGVAPDVQAFIGTIKVTGGPVQLSHDNLTVLGIWGDSSCIAIPNSNHKTATSKSKGSSSLIWFPTAVARDLLEAHYADMGNIGTALPIFVCFAQPNMPAGYAYIGHWAKSMFHDNRTCACTRVADPTQGAAAASETLKICFDFDRFDQELNQIISACHDKNTTEIKQIRWKDIQSGAAAELTTSADPSAGAKREICSPQKRKAAILSDHTDSRAPDSTLRNISIKKNTTSSAKKLINGVDRDEDCRADVRVSHPEREVVDDHQDAVIPAAQKFFKIYVSNSDTDHGDSFVVSNKLGMTFRDLRQAIHAQLDFNIEFERFKFSVPVLGDISCKQESYAVEDFISDSGNGSMGSPYQVTIKLYRKNR